MDSDDMLLIGGLALGGFAIWKIFSDNGVAKTTDAAGDIAQTASGVVSNAGGLLNDTITAIRNPSTAYKTPGLLQLSPFYQATNTITRTLGGLFNTKKPSALPTPPPIMTNIGITAEGAYFSSAKPLIANTSTKYGAASQTTIRGTPTIGAKAGTIFSKSASVKSVGASGKYRKY